eukprot:TRINITY_DN1581_c0_g1_i2.p1 TRINITY_DN1581_c0_g1~~TRINITY_DN1581_c0_g1_i2.p1  ORF type:complete len:672 (-),score=12.02 TRINITY_DN1581_c0_g1_i2:1006-3021(-)
MLRKKRKKNNSNEIYWNQCYLICFYLHNYCCAVDQVYFLFLNFNHTIKDLEVEHTKLNTFCHQELKKEINMINFKKFSQLIEKAILFNIVVVIQFMDSAVTEDRFTLSGDKCIFPTTYNNTLYQDCFQVYGKQMCYIEGGKLQVCALHSPRSNPNSNPNFAPYPEIIHNRNSTTVIQTKSDNITSSGAERYTLHGGKCDPIYLHKGTVYTDCMKVGSKEYCEVNGIVYECRPLNNTTVQEANKSSDANNSKMNETVVPINSTANSIRGMPPIRYTIYADECDRNFESDTMGISIEQQSYFNDTGCMLISNQEYCFVKDVLQPCAPKNSTEYIPVQMIPMWQQLPSDEDTAKTYNVRFTTDGLMCTFPFVYNKLIATDCVYIYGMSSCYINDEWHQCEPVRHQYKLKQINNSSDRYTITGKKCQFPLYHNGIIYTDCFMLGNQSSCEINGEFFECASLDNNLSQNTTSWISKNKSQNVTVDRRVTIDGQLCDFPYVYKGQKQFGCQKFGKIELCKINESWSECAASTTQGYQSSKTHSNSTEQLRQEENQRSSTTKGQYCTQPFTQEGTQYEDCVPINGTYWCILDGQWEHCLHPQSTNISNVPNSAIKNNDSLSQGEIAAIVLAIVVGFFAVVTGLTVVYFVYYKQRGAIKQLRFEEFQEPVIREVEMQEQ